MHKLAAGALVSALSLTPLVASAQQGMLDNLQPYAGAGAGWLSLDDGALDEDDWGFKLFGGARVGPYLGGELGYVNFGEVEDAGAAFEADGLTAAVQGYWPVQNLPLQPFAEAGALFWEADTTGIAGDDDGTDFFWGLGADFNIQREFGVRVAWDRYQLDEVDADLLSASAIWNF